MWGKARYNENGIQCSLLKPATVYIEAVPRWKIEALMGEYPHQEWLAYLVGRATERGFCVSNIHVPPHAEAAGASAEAEPFNQPKDCLGVIHSHHHMGAFHSGIDDSYVDRNFPVSITVAFGRNNGGGLEYDAVSYQVTECGKSTMLKCTVKYVQPKPGIDIDKFLERAKANIEKAHKSYRVLETKIVGERNYLQKEPPYIPMRYRLAGDNNLKPVVTDQSGRVLTQTELDDILANSTPD